MNDYLPPMGNLRRPRKTNTRALKRIAEGDLLWDKRAVERAAAKAAKKAAEHETNRSTGRLSRVHRTQLLNRLGSRWSWNHRVNPYSGGALLAPAAVSIDDLDRLIAGLSLPYVKRATVAIAGLDPAQFNYVLSKCPSTVCIYTTTTSGGLLRVRRRPAKE